MSELVGPDGRAPDGNPTDEQLAYAMQKARQKLMIHAMRAMREQMQVEIQGARLLLNIDMPESKALQAGVAAACVTAGQLLCDNMIVSFSKRLDEIHKRLAALEAAGAKVVELSAKLDQAIAGFVGAPPLTDAERVDMANAAQLAALGEGADEAGEVARKLALPAPAVKVAQALAQKFEHPPTEKKP